MNIETLTRRPAGWRAILLGVTVAALLGVGAAILPEAIANSPKHVFMISSHPSKASASMIIVCLTFVLIAWRTTWVDQLGKPSAKSLFVLSTAPILIPYLTNPLSFMLNGNVRPNWQLWFLKDATPYFEASLLATVMLFAVAASAISRNLSASIRNDEDKSGLPTTIPPHLTVATGLAIWTAIVSVLGKHPLASLSGVLVVGFFWIRFQISTTTRCSCFCTSLAVTLGYALGALWPLMWCFILRHWGLVAFAAGLGVVLNFFVRDSDDSKGWRLAAEGAIIGAIGSSVGVGLSVVWVFVELGIETLLGVEKHPTKWADVLTQAGVLIQDRFGLGYAAANVRDILVSANWLGAVRVVTLPHAWDDYILLTLMGKYGLFAGVVVVMILMIFLWLTYSGVQKLNQGFLRTFGLMLWSFLALSCVINLQANIGILPGVPYLGLPFLSYHWFLAMLGGVVMGMALRGYTECSIDRTGRTSNCEHEPLQMRDERQRNCPVIDRGIADQPALNGQDPAALLTC